MGRKSQRFNFANSAALHQALRERGVPEDRVEAAAEEVAQHNQLDSTEQIKPEITITFPDGFRFGDEVVILSDQVSKAADFRAKTERPQTGERLGGLGLYGLRDLERATWDVLSTLRDSVDAVALKSAVQSAHELIDKGALSGVDRDDFMGVLDRVEQRLLGGSRRYAEGQYALPGGGQLAVRPGGEFRYLPASAAESASLEQLGFMAMDDGTLGLPRRHGAAGRKPGVYAIPGEIALLVDAAGTLRVDPKARNPGALEAAGFSREQDGSYTPPTQPEGYRLPGGTRLEVMDDGDLMIDTGRHDPELLERLGFVWDDEEGLMHLPPRPGAEALEPGVYPMAGGAALVVRGAGELLLNPGAHDPAGLVAQGFKPVGEGLLAFPSSANRRP